MTIEKGKVQPKISHPDAVIEDYLDRFARTGDQSAILVSSNGTEQTMSLMDGTRLYSPSILAEKFGMKQKTIKKLLSSGKIKGVMIGNAWLTSEEAVKAYQDNRAKIG